MRYSYEGDPNDAFEFFGKGKQELDRLRTRMKTQGVESGRFQHALSDDAYCYGTILPGGIETLHIVTAPGVEPSITFNLQTIPDFLSGISKGQMLEAAAGSMVMSSFYPTNDSAQAHKAELPNGAWQMHLLQRFAIGLDPALNFLSDKAVGAFEVTTDPNAVQPIFIDPLHPEFPIDAGPDFRGTHQPFYYTRPTYTFAQYHWLKPSMYSGKMRGVIQALMGFGRQRTDANGDPISIYQDVIDDSEAVAAALPKELTAYETDVKEHGLRIEYDFRSFRTHGICTATDGELWLVEISLNRGCIAMKLPLHKATTLPEFRDSLDAMPDPDGIALLDEFGGFPTGESFPGVNATVEAYIRAGKIVRLLSTTDMAPFWWNGPYSIGVGWCFNKSGTEAHQTAYYFGDDDRQRGVHYGINFHFGTPLHKEAGPVDDALAAVFESFRSKPEYEDKVDAALYKLAYMTEEQYRGMNGLSSEDSFKYVDALILTPEIPATARLSKAGEGNLYWPTKYQPEIKFPDYDLQCLLSHDLRPGYFGRYKPAPYCDTVMHVFFVDDELKYCKYYLNPNQDRATAKAEGDSDFDINWNPVGQFARTTTYGPFGVPAMFYTNDLDDRDELGSAVTQERFKRWDNGWIAVVGGGGMWINSWGGDSNNAGTLEPDFWEGGDYENHKRTISKFKWFWCQGWADVTNGLDLKGAIAVPMFDRCAMYYAKMSGNNGGSDTFSEKPGFLTSPWIGHSYARIERTRGECGWPPANIDSPLLQPDPQYWAPTNDNPYCFFQDIADEGDWVPHCTPADPCVYGSDTMAMVNGMAHSKTIGKSMTKTLEINLIAHNAGVARASTQVRTDDRAIWWDPKWFRPSPDPETGFTCFIAATENCLGEAEISAFNTDMDSADVVLLGTDREIMKDVTMTFHGVVNG